ncbi:MAG: helix-turn-helix domain-containing protein [Bacillota bacterium]
MKKGQRIARLRLSRGDSLRAAAKRTGVSHSTIARIEKGEVTASYQETIRKIAEGYQVPVEFLLTGISPERVRPLYTLHQLTAEDRAVLLFAQGRERIRRALALLTSEGRGRLTREQFAVMLGIEPEVLDQALEGTVSLPDRLIEKLSRQLGALTGLSPLWFQWGLSEESPPEQGGEPDWPAYFRLAMKSARVRLHPDLLKM